MQRHQKRFLTAEEFDAIDNASASQAEAFPITDVQCHTPGTLPVQPAHRLTTAEWRARKLAHTAQAESFESSEIFKATVEAKLTEAGWSGPSADNFFKCGHAIFYRECRDCGSTKPLAYHCNLKWCPSCNWRITATRKTELRKITEGCDGLKHMVLTQRNFQTLTQSKIRECRKHLLKLRRKKIMGKVTAGTCSLEFTNESKGWHMHWHLLLQVPFVCEQELAIQWGRLVSQEFAIVRCRAVHGADYVTEVCKYVVGGSEIARWPASQILEFVTAMDGTRLYSMYGTWTKRRKQVRAQMKQAQSPAICECGSEHFIFGDDETFLRRDLRSRR